MINLRTDDYVELHAGIDTDAYLDQLQAWEWGKKLSVLSGTRSLFGKFDLSSETRNLLDDNRSNMLREKMKRDSFWLCLRRDRESLTEGTFLLCGLHLQQPELCLHVQEKLKTNCSIEIALTDICLIYTPKNLPTHVDSPYRPLVINHYIINGEYGKLSFHKDKVSPPYKTLITKSNTTYLINSSIWHSVNLSDNRFNRYAIQVVIMGNKND